MRVHGGHGIDPDPEGKFGEGIIAGRVEGMVVVPQFDCDMVATEGLDQSGQLLGGGGRTGTFEC